MPVSHLIASDPDDDSVHALTVEAGDAVDAQLRYEIRSPAGARSGTAYVDLADAVAACKTANTGQPTSWYVVIPVIHANP